MSEKTWKLRRTVQCAKCPWRKDTDPNDIPNGYDVEKHQKLARTIAKPGDWRNIFDPEMRIMACHEEHESHCIGWLMNQLGPGNNIALRLRMTTCANGDKIRLIGEQHEHFRDTLPKGHWLKEKLKKPDEV